MTNYQKLTLEEAEDCLRNHDEADWSDDRLWNEVIEPRDVLYYLDAFGDQSLAINCQGLPKDLPDRVIEAVDEYDVFNDWLGKVSEMDCPVSGRTLYEFDWKYEYLYIDEYGDHHEFPEHLTDYAGYYWDATEEHRVMTQHSKESFPRMDAEITTGEVRVFYGESNEFSRFSHTGGVIRWDFMWDMDYDKSTDLWNVREDDKNLLRGHEIAAAFAKGRSERDAMMERIGFKRIHVKEIDQSVKGTRRFWRYAKETLKGWATLDSEAMVNEPTHPDLDFTYIIEGPWQAWVHEDDYGKFKGELIWQSLREANDNETASEYRSSNNEVLA